MGPPPHLETLLLVTTTVMVTGGVASRWITRGGDDDIYAIGSDESEVDSEATPIFGDDEGERSGLIRHDICLHEKKHLSKRGSPEGIAEENCVS